jgi:hypothetical protein
MLRIWGYLFVAQTQPLSCLVRAAHKWLFYGIRVALAGYYLHANRK